MDALLLLDEPMLNSRYHGLLFRMQDEQTREKLAKLPSLVLETIRLGRRGAVEWGRAGAATMDEEFDRVAERFLLQSFLILAEEQLRLIAFMARSAPAQEARAYFDEMADVQRHVASTLRGVLGSTHQRLAARDGRGLRGVQEEENAGDLRGQVEGALRAFREAGLPPRVVILSPTGLRHLRDQGLRQDGESTILGVPASIDFGWGGPAFAVQSFDLVPVEEIMRPDDGWEPPAERT